MDSKTIIGFDFGQKYLGIATGQSISKSATPLTTIKNINGKPNWPELNKLIGYWSPNLIVIGDPGTKNKSLEKISNQIKVFADDLREKFQLPIFLVDETLSSWEAKDRLGLKHQQSYSNKNLLEINAMAAAIIIEIWLENNPTA